jgi:hypothetical protein
MTEVDNLVAARGGSTKKKQSPQEAWMELLHSSVSTAPPAIKHHLQQMVTLDNVPRKEKQFRNFASNSLNLRGGGATKVLDAIWNHLNTQRELQKKAKEEQQEKSKQEKDQKQQQQQSPDETTGPTCTTINTKDMPSNNVSDTETGTLDGNQHHKEADQQEQQQKQNQEDDEDKMYTRVKKATKKLLKKAPGKSMKYKSLQKVIREKIGTSKEALKELMKRVVAKEGKNFLLEGKQLKLVIS